MTEKAWLIKQIQTERSALDKRLHAIPAEQLEQSLRDGNMTVKEELYHIAWYERQMIGLLRARALVSSPWWDLPTDERNANIQAEAAPLTVEEVLASATAAIYELLDELQALPSEALDNPAYFADMPSDWSPTDILAQNTYEHYQDHLVR